MVMVDWKFRISLDSNSALGTKQHTFRSREAKVKTHGEEEGANVRSSPVGADASMSETIYGKTHAGVDNTIEMKQNMTIRKECAPRRS